MERTMNGILSNFSTRPSKNSWIFENFQKRECARFIPTSSGSDKCCCGRIKEVHNKDALLPPALQDSTWVSSRHTVASPTDAYGEIEFHGAGHCSRAKYIRVAHDTDAELAYRLLSSEWRIGLPKLLISVTGGAKNFVLQNKLKRILRDGLLKAAQTTGAWIITGGTNTGVMKHVGEAVRGHTVMSRGAQLKDSAHQVHLIGIASWGIVNHRDLLVNTKEPVTYHMTSSMKSKGACLDNNHSHFILVDNGTVEQYGVEISFRANLENCIARKTMAESCSWEMSNVADVVEHRQLLHKIEKAFPGCDPKGCLALYKSVLKCVAKREYITVFSVDEGALDIDKAILRALLKGQNALPKHQLSLALVWDRADIAKSEIFAEDIKWKVKH
ncbi:transient receptor potential cation channel subfamily M member 3-like [Actinia tenebrosa]|uniref:Transient receptor potential cation channel subfamily M member 3-like n=1 Tax=Actinia tenebrosa TaxID=6105 RepID=A0A6P8ITF9_ACTTE|nr:transient receptor potential cation channel subfamily M member 3-like [Actinia tenebrosa]